MASVEPGLVVLRLWQIVIEEDVGQHHRADLDPVIEQSVHRQMIEHLAAEAANRPLLDRDHDLVLAHQPVDEIDVERLGEARIGDRRRQAVSGELLRRLHAFGEPAPKAQQRDRSALAQDPPAPDLKRYPRAQAIRPPMPSPRG